MTGCQQRAIAVLVPRSAGGASPLDPPEAITARTVSLYRSCERDAKAACNVLLEQDFRVLNFHRHAISFSGTPAQFQQVFGLRLKREAHHSSLGQRGERWCLDPADGDKLLDLPGPFTPHGDGIAIAVPPDLYDGRIEQRPCLWGTKDSAAKSDPLPPLRPPAASRRRLPHHGAVVALIGMGYYRHPHFARQGYRILPTLLGPGQSAPMRDDHGHGTCEAARLLAAAPDIRLRPIKGLLDPAGDLFVAMDSTPRPGLMVAAWGYDVDHGSWDELRARDPNLHHYLRVLEVAVADAAAQGTVLCFADGPGARSFPAAHPDVVSVNAAFDLEHAKGHESRLYPGRYLPDLWSALEESGKPHTKLPLQPGSFLDRIGSAANDNGDDWVWFDGGSAICAEVTAIVAWLLERAPRLPPAEVKSLLIEAAKCSSRGPGGTPAAEGTAPLAFEMPTGHFRRGTRGRALG